MTKTRAALSEASTKTHNTTVSATGLLQEMVLHALGRCRSQRLLFQQGNMLRAPQPSHVTGAQTGGHFTGFGKLEFGGISLAAHDDYVIKVISVLYWLLNSSVRTERRAREALGPQKLEEQYGVMDVEQGARHWERRGGSSMQQTWKWVRASLPKHAGLCMRADRLVLKQLRCSFQGL